MNRRTMVRGLLGVSGLIDVVHASRNAQRIEVGGSTLDVFIDSDRFELGREALLNWVRRSANAVTAYFGRFPVANARVYIAVSQTGRVSNGVSYGEGGAHCRISVGQHTTVEDLHNDWELTHEMIHFSFPSVADHHHWIEEGIATYVEPIARASIGVLTAEQVWGEMLRDMPQGQPQAGDRGLDRTHTWARTYWGGALFCLQADVEIRKRTGNAKGLQDARRVAKGDSESHFHEAWANADQVVIKQKNQLLDDPELVASVGGVIASICQTDTNETIRRFKVGLLTRFLFSCLIDADRTDTADSARPPLAY
jgi:hypothetical protein